MRIKNNSLPAENELGGSTWMMQDKRPLYLEPGKLGAELLIRRAFGCRPVHPFGRPMEVYGHIAAGGSP